MSAKRQKPRTSCSNWRSTDIAATGPAIPLIRSIFHRTSFGKRIIADSSGLSVHIFHIRSIAEQEFADTTMFPYSISSWPGTLARSQSTGWLGHHLRSRNGSLSQVSGREHNWNARSFIFPMVVLG